MNLAEKIKDILNFEGSGRTIAVLASGMFVLFEKSAAVVYSCEDTNLNRYENHVLEYFKHTYI